MKANEFVKKFGWGEAQKCLPYCSKRGDFIYYKNIEVNFNDLKRLVASWELVQEFGGLEHAKRFYDENLKCDDAEVLCKAIADVESCQ